MNMVLRKTEAYGSGMGGKSGGGSSTEEKNTLLSNATAYLLDFVSQGPIRGLVNGNKSIFFDGVPLENQDGSRNFQGLDYDWRIGEENQAPNRLLDTTESEIGVNIQVTAANGAVTRVIDEENLDAFRVRVRIPSLMKVKDNGDIVAHSVSYSIMWAPAGTGNFQHISGSPFNLTGKNSAPYYVDHTFTPPIAGPWDVRMRRDSPDEGTVKNSSETWFDAIVGILNQKMIYPWSAYFAWQVKAEQFGSSLPKRTYEIYGRIIRIPSNYDPETRTYTGMWDGTFKLGYTDCPPWVLLDMLTNTRYGGMISDNKIDLAALYTIAKYCDEMVPDGRGGVEPRYTINVCINTQTEAYSLLNNMLSSFRTMLYWRGGQFSFSQDAPNNRHAVLVGPSNTENGFFSYTTSTDKSRGNTIYVQYNNPANQDKPDFEIVNDNKDVVKRGPKIVRITAWGCRSQAQARRHGSWLRYTLNYDTEKVSYVAGLDHEEVKPGDIIAIADPLKSSTRQSSGRLISADATSVFLDRTVDLNQNYTYQIALTDVDGNIQYRDLQTFANNIRSFGLTEPIDPAKFGVNSVWIIYRKDTGTRKYRVTSISEKGGKRLVSALLYNPSKFPYVERDQPLTPQPVDPFVGGDIAPPRYFTYTRAEILLGGTANRIDCLVSWTYPENENRITGFELQYADDSENPNWETVYRGRETSFTIKNILGSETTKALRIKSLGPDPNKDFSPWISISNIELFSRAVQPLSPTVLNVLALSYGKGIQISWTPFTPPADFWYVEVWRSLTPQLNQATIVGTGTDGVFVDNELTPGQQYYYWIRTRVRTDNPTKQYSGYLGPQYAAALPPPITDVLDDSITSQKIRDAAIIAEKIANGAVTGTAIAADSVGANHVAANAITAKQVVLTDFTNLLRNGMFDDISPATMNAIWDFSGGPYLGASNPDPVTGFWGYDTGAQNGQYQLVMDRPSFASGDPASTLTMTTKDFTTVTAGEQWRWEVQGRTNGSLANAGFYVDILWYDANKSPVSTSTPVNNVGFPVQYGAAYSGKVTVPANARFCKFRLRHTNQNLATRYFIIDRVSFRRANAAELIVDGTIIAAHLAANSVTASAIAAGSITADKISVTSLSAMSVNAGEITAGLIRSADNKLRLDLNNVYLLMAD